MSEKKIKVVWVCHFSNKTIRSQLKMGFYLLDFIRKIIGKTPVNGNDFAVWNTNAIKSFENFNDIDLNIIMPHSGIRPVHQEFTIHGIRYFCFRSEDDHIMWHLNPFNRWHSSYNKNREYIKNIVNRIKPDIVHIIGAENPYYSLSALDVENGIVTIISLQTLMSEPGFYENYPINKKEYEYRSKIERDVIRNCSYISTSISNYRDYIKKEINNNPEFLNMPLAVGVDINDKPCQKQFDFVYFAANINKAADEAIEAFGLLCDEYPKLTLDISGGYDEKFLRRIQVRLDELGIRQNVTISGPKKTHEDVINHIKKARFALLPLKVDLISGTLREAMACGIPVVSTITPATPELNVDRESILLSPKGDFKNMANKMKLLIEDKKLREKLRANAIKTVEERYSNRAFMEKWRMAYIEISKN